MGNIGSVANALTYLNSHFIVTNDKGKIAQAEAFILPGVGAFEEGMDHLENLKIKSVLENQVLDKKILFQKQDDNQATYANKITSEIRKIDFNDDVYNIYNKIRAFAPKPSAWFTLDKEHIKIIQCSLRVCEAKPSTIINDHFHIGCKNGKIIPEIIQREGKRPMEIREFLNGFSFDVGQIVNV